LSPFFKGQILTLLTAQSLPFPLLGLDNDNGSEFINEWLRDWGEARAIRFTRSRAGHKNDRCFVEQKTTPACAGLYGEVKGEPTRRYTGRLTR
jgi:hypothetical protein